MEKYYIYGYGKKGNMILRLLKDDVIAGIIDNYKSMVEKDIYSFDEIKDEIGKNRVIVCVPENHCVEIEQQLKFAGIDNYVLFEDFVNKINEVNKLSDLGALSNDLRLIQNLESEVEFYVVDSFELDHYLPIYNFLKSRGINAQIVIEPEAISSVGDYIDFKKCITRLCENQIPYTTFRNPNARIAITTQFARCLKHYKNKKCQLSYGVALYKPVAFQMIYENEKEFDCFLVHGQFQKNHLINMLERGDVFVIGYPKYWNHNVKKDGVLQKKKTLLYCPTWDEYSSIKEYSNEINRLREDFHVISRPHHCTWRLEEKIQEKNILIASSDEILLSEANIMDKLDNIDVVLCDAKSGIVFEMVFLNPDVRVAIITDKVKMDDFYLDLKNMVLTIDNPCELESKINSLFKGDALVEKRKQIIEELYDRTNGEMNLFVDYVKQIGEG